MQRIVAIGEVAVVDQDVAFGPHPRWPDQQVAYAGIAYVMLENGVSGFACETCGYMKDTIRQVASHLRAHNGKDAEPLYPLETLKSLIRTVKRLKPLHKNYMERAAADLNRRGVESIDKQPWTAVRVGRLYNRWEPEIKVSIPPQQRQPESAPAAVKARAVTTVRSGMDPLVRRLITIGEKLDDLSNEYERLVSDVAVQLAEGKEIDPEILEKATKWDALDQSVFEKAAKFDAAQSLFGGGK